jgi:iron-sulfur cluster assembly protein
MPNLFDVTDRAAARARGLLAGRGSDAALRVRVIPGGCSGLSYVLEPLTGPAPAGDRRVESNGLVVFVERQSLLYLAGTTLDYETNMFASRFTFKNPNAAEACSCGDSFAPRAGLPTENVRPTPCKK